MHAQPRQLAAVRSCRCAVAPTSSPTTRLLHQVPIRTFAEWQDATVGQMGAGLVGHDGGVDGGEHAFTLVLTDHVTQWTEPRAELNKPQKWVFQALLLVRS